MVCVLLPHHFHPIPFSLFSIMSTQQGKAWVFTINNWTTADYDHLALKFQDVVYAVVGKEVSSTGTPHLQGYAAWPTNKRFAAARELIGLRARISRARGNAAENRVYCTKGGDFEEWNECPVTAQGKRTDLERAFEWADGFEEANGRPAESPDVAKEFPSILCKYPRFTRTINLRAKRVLFDSGELSAWQRELSQALDQPPDDRKVVFYVDSDGGKGKTWFCRYFWREQQERTQILSCGKADDIAHAIQVSKSVFLFNIPRGGMEYLSYRVLEGIKDRMIWSGKYNSAMKFLRNNAHVIVFCNEEPNMSKLTADRYDIKYI